MAIVEALVIGIIAGVVASLCYALIKRVVRPKIKIASVIIHDEDNDIMIIKVINRTKTRITDVECYLQYYKYLTNGYNVRDLQSKRKITPTIERYENDKDTVGAPSLYAVQYGFTIPDDVSFDEKDKLVFSIKGVHPVSGTITYETKEFVFDGRHVLKDVCYDAGDNIGVHKKMM